MTNEVQRDTKPRKRRAYVPPIFTPEQRAAADADLLASGAELRTLKELGAELGVSAGRLKGVVWPVRTVRYLSTSNPTLYCAKDVREAVAPHLERLRERHAAHLTEEAAGAARQAERTAKHAKVVASKAKRAGGATATSTPSKPMGQPGPTPKHTSAFPPRSLGNPFSSRPAPPRRPEPEVFIMRRRPVPTP